MERLVKVDTTAPADHTHPWGSSFDGKMSPVCHDAHVLGPPRLFFSQGFHLPFELPRFS